MKFNPYPYQTYAINKITDGCVPYENGVGLFLEMGLGKTVCALTAIKLLRDKGEIKKTLVIGTLRIVDNVWPEEINKWDHLSNLTYSKVIGNERSRINALNKDVDVYMINRENVPWLISVSRNWNYDMIVIDELTSFKSHTSKRFKELRKVTKITRYVVGMTGSPSPNGLMDLWAQIYLLDRGNRLGRNITEFRNRYFRPGLGSGRIIYNWIPLEGSQENIFNAIDDICVSMKAKDWIYMPESIYNIVKVDLPFKAREQYNTLKKECILRFKDSDVVAAEAAVLVHKLMQISNGAVYDEYKGVQDIHGAKLDVLEELIEEANGNPVLVFYNYRHDLNRILCRIPTARKLENNKDIEDWNKGDIPVLLAHPASAGHGLNLQSGGHIVIWFGMTWNLELYQQSNARILRQGQQHTVIIHHIIGNHTIDEKVFKVLTSKTECQNILMEALKATIDNEEVT